MPDWRVRRIVLGGNEFHILITEPENVNRFLKQIRVRGAYVTELGGRDAHEQNSIAGVAVPRRLQPGVVGVPVDFLLQGVEDARPRIRDDGRTGERHCLSESVYQNIENCRSKNVQKRPVLKLKVPLFTAEQLLFCSTG